MKYTGKKIFSAVLCAVLLLLTAGCGSAPQAASGTNSQAASQADDSAGSVASKAENAESGQASATADTRTVSTVMGDIEVPADPQRVVVNWFVGDVYSAGLNVVGFYCWAQESMPFYEDMMATTKIENWAPEDVMTLEPDLIITYAKEDFETFKKVAPVLVIEESISSPERTKFIGEATGHTQAANKTVETFETKLAAAKEIFQADAFAGKTFSIMEDWGASGEWSGVAYETGSRGGTLVYDYLGLKYPEKLTELIASTGEGRGTISYEVAHEYFGDYILWCRQEGKESEYAQMDIWKSIPAVAQGRVLEIPGELQGMFYYDDVLSLTAQLEYLVEKINTLVK